MKIHVGRWIGIIYISPRSYQLSFRLPGLFSGLILSIQKLHTLKIHPQVFKKFTLKQRTILRLTLKIPQNSKHELIVMKRLKPSKAFPLQLEENTLRWLNFQDRTAARLRLSLASGCYTLNLQNDPRFCPVLGPDFCWAGFFSSSKSQLKCYLFKGAASNLYLRQLHPHYLSQSSRSP